MQKIDSTIMGQRIKLQREALNISREHLAEMIGITVKFCSDIESGARGTSLQTLMKLSNSLKVSTDYILFGDTSKTSDQIFLQVIHSCPEAKREYLLLALEKIVAGFNA